MPLKHWTCINGIGSYLPEKVMTNADFETMIDTSDEWIFSRTGIKERRIAAPKETSSDMAFVASQRAIEDAGIDPQKIQMILVGTMTPDYPCPNVAALLQKKLGVPRGCAVMDISAACSGYLYALAVAKGFIEAGMADTILVVGVEKMSSIIDYTDRSTCVLFGDGASAAVVSNKQKGFVVDTVCLGGDGYHSDLMIVPAGGSAEPASKDSVEQRKHYFTMNGKEVFKLAVRTMESAAKECLEKSSLKMEDISWLIPHQANSRIIDAVAQRTSLPKEKVVNEVWRYGNTSAASVAIAMDDLIKEKNVVSGEKILLVAFGAGITWASALVTKL